MVRNHQTQASSHSHWAWLGLYAACAAIVVGNLGRYLPPSGDRFVDLLSPGAADLIPSVNAAEALLHGDNPYHSVHVMVKDPYEESRGSKEGFTYLYPPSHALLYVPLVRAAHGDYQLAQTLQFVVELLCAGLLAGAIMMLLSSVIALDASVLRALFAIVCLLLTLNVGNQLGIERGQSDIVTAALAWWGVVAFQRRWLTTSAFLCVASVLLKGYGIALAAGILLLSLRLSWRRTLIGATCALLLLLVPVAKYLPDAVAAYRIRSAMFWSSWTNQSFANVSHSLGIARDNGRLGLTLSALGVTAAAWMTLERKIRTHSDASEQTLWTITYAAASLMTVLGYSLNCIAYSCVIVMPGVLLLALCQEQLLVRTSALVRNTAGVWLTAAMFALFIFDVGLAIGSSTKHFPLNGAAMIAVLYLIGAVAVGELAPTRHVRKYIACATVLLGLCFAVPWAWPALQSVWDGPDLAAGRPWTASSEGLRCIPEQRNCGGGDRGVFFHTALENQPWLRIELDSVYDVSSVRIQNRKDCCTDRAVPLVIELSIDGKDWREVSRRKESFEEWRASFDPSPARYVRLRIERRSILHLERVSVGGSAP